MAGVAAVATIFSTAYGFKSSQDAAKDQRRAAAESEALGRENAANIEAETSEKARRLSKEQAVAESTARARASASGAKGGSQEAYIGEMGKEHGRQLDWLKQSGKREARLAAKAGATAGRAGRAQASATKAGGYTQLLAGAGTFASAGVKEGWW